MPFGSYERIEKLGKGSYGEVFLVKHKVEKKLYAIKTVDIDNMNKESKKSCQKEIEIMKKLIHPNESYTNRNTSKLQIVMEYCDGTDLSKMIERYKEKRHHLKESIIMNYFVQILLGLNFMHQKNIIHRDIKPANIFLLGNGRLVIGDLGVSKNLGGTSSHGITTTGTPYFMAPEVYEGRKYDYKADIWSLGVLLYYMATFHHPFGGKCMKELVDNITTANYKPITYYTKLYSKDMEELIKRMLTVDPSSRPGSFQLLTGKYVQQHLVTLFHEILSRPSNKMGEGTINIKNALREYAKENGMKVSVEDKIVIPVKYNIYVKQLKDIGILDNIVNTIWKKKEPTLENRIKQHRLAIAKQKKYIIEESLDKVKKQKENKQQQINKRRIKNIKNNNQQKKVIINTELPIIPEKCLSPTILLDSDIPHNPNPNPIDIHSSPDESKKDDDDDDDYDKNTLDDVNDIDSDNLQELKDDGWAIPNTDEFENIDELNRIEEQLNNELFVTCKSIDELQSEIKANGLEGVCVFTHDDKDDKDEKDDKSDNEEENNCEGCSKVNSLKRKCESIRANIIDGIGKTIYQEVYEYLKEMKSKNDDQFLDINDPKIIDELIPIFHTDDKKNILKYGNKICDVIFMEEF